MVHAVLTLYFWYKNTLDMVICQSFAKLGGCDIIKSKHKDTLYVKHLMGTRGYTHIPKSDGRGDYAFHYQTFASYLLTKMKRIFCAFTWIIPAFKLCAKLISCDCMIFFINFWYLCAIVKKSTLHNVELKQLYAE